MSDSSLSSQLERVNKELWLLLSLFAIAAVLNFIVSGQRMVLAFGILTQMWRTIQPRQVGRTPWEEGADALTRAS